MKALEIIKKTVVTILVVAFFGFVLAMTILLLNRNEYGVTEMDGTSWIMINDDISSLSRDEEGKAKYEKGDLLFVHVVPFSDIKVGDEIFAYRRLKPEDPVTIDLGTVADILEEEKQVMFENGSAYSPDFIIGKTKEVKKDWAKYLSVILSQWGFLFIVLVPSFLIFIYQLYALIVEIKYNK